MTRRKKFNDAPMAVTSEGCVIVNLAHLLDPADLRRLQAKLPGVRGVIFAGVEVPRRLRHQLRVEVTDVLADVVGRLDPEVRRG